MSSGKIIGYRRVSTVDQNADRQLEGVEVDEMFTDYASGKDRDRPQLAEMLRYVRAGDTVIVHSLDRLGRNVDDLRHLITDMTQKGVTVKICTQGLTFTGDDNPMNRMLLTMLGAVAEFELAMIRERQAEGIAVAKAKGKYKGRRPSLSDAQAAALLSRVEAGESVAALAREYGVSRETVYSYKRKAG